MTSLLRILRLGFAAATLSIAHADTVTITFSGIDLRNQSNVPLANGGLVLLLANVGTASTAGVSFGTLSAGSLSVGSILNGTYQILGRAEIDNSFGTSDAASIAGPITFGDAPFSNLSVGDQLAVAWFPTLTFATDFSLVSGTSYGLYTQNGAPNWTISVGTISVETPAGLTANSISAIPEPSTYAAIVGAAALGLAVFRRRKSNQRSTFNSQRRTFK